ncbi:MAG: DUF4430 domain-containing protein [Clostridia bacterium]|nr:DUF4430 domain-containing protein [Clostridia bacterium]
MKQTNFSKWLSLILCMVLIAAVALCFTGCNNDTPAEVPQDATQTEAKEVGTGKTTFTFTVTDTEGKETVFTVHTDKTVVGEALQENGLIAGEESEFGLYVKTVNGITLDYNKDGKYWAFYENGTMAAKGVDSTEIKADGAYAFKAE